MSCLFASCFTLIDIVCRNSYLRKRSINFRVCTKQRQHGVEYSIGYLAFSYIWNITLHFQIIKRPSANKLLYMTLDESLKIQIRKNETKHNHVNQG